RQKTVAHVVAVATPAAVAHVEHLFTDDALEQIRSQGSGEVRIGPKPVRVGRDFLEDLHQHDVAAAAASLRRPLLVVQAGADTVVGRDQTEALAEAGSATLHTVDGADHLFGDRRHSDELVQTILDWLRGLRA
ncbi:MAG: hypothetical protein OXC00_13350, partial [Acidimicrobiaceae bacterium]|nr:hypothetical protein [Acidimicrobiaceae bacterium]